MVKVALADYGSFAVIGGICDPNDSTVGGKGCYDVVACTLHRVIGDTVRVAKP